MIYRVLNMFEIIRGQFIPWFMGFEIVQDGADLLMISQPSTVLTYHGCEEAMWKFPSDRDTPIAGWLLRDYIEETSEHG